MRWRLAEGKPCLAWACQQGHDDIVSCLIERFFRTSQTDSASTPKNAIQLDIENRINRPFKIACLHGHAKIVTMLLALQPNLECSACICIEDDMRAVFSDNFCTACKCGKKLRLDSLGWAGLSGQAEMLRILLNGGAKGLRTTALASAVHLGQEDVIRVLLDWGFPAKFEYESRVAMNLAAALGHDSVLLLLLSDERCKRYVDAPLRVAAARGRLNAVAILVAAGADVGNQALFKAVQGGFDEVVLLLLKAGWGEEACEEERAAMANGMHGPVVQSVLGQ